MDTQGRPAAGPLNPPRPAPGIVTNGKGSGTHPQSGDPLDAMLRASGVSASSEFAQRPERQRVVAEKAKNHEAQEAIWDKLNTEPWTLDFFATVRRLEALYADRPGFGWSNKASEDPVRFCQKAMLAFPSCTLQEYDPPRDNAPPRLFVNFTGLWGPNGPMPLHLTEYAFEREKHHKDRTLARFMDIFHHRIISLFYRAWAASQMPASFDRWLPVPDGGTLSEDLRQQVLLNDSDRYAIYIGSLFGLGMPSVRHRDAVPDTAKLFMAGRMTGYHRGPEGIRAIIQDYFGIRVMIEEFSGRWLDMPPQDHCKIGRSSAVASTLGSLSGFGGAVMGAKVWDAQGMFRLRLGPMKYKDYERFLPGRPAATRLEAWIRNYVGDEFAWEATLELRAADVPRTKLGSGSRLGWTTWCTSGVSPEDRSDLAIRSRR